MCRCQHWHIVVSIHLRRVAVSIHLRSLSLTSHKVNLALNYSLTKVCRSNVFFTFCYNQLLLMSVVRFDSLCTFSFGESIHYRLLGIIYLFQSFWKLTKSFSLVSNICLLENNIDVNIVGQTNENDKCPRISK